MSDFTQIAHSRKPIKWVPEILLEVHIPAGDDEYKKPFATTMRIARSFQRVPVPELPESTVVVGRPIPDIRDAMDRAPGWSEILISVIDGRNVPGEVFDEGGVMTIGTTIPSLAALRHVQVGIQGGVYYMVGVGVGLTDVRQSH